MNNFDRGGGVLLPFLITIINSKSMRYLLLLLLFAGGLSAQTATPLQLQILTPTPESMGEDRDIVADRLDEALAHYQIETNRKAEFALLPHMRLNKATYTEATITLSTVSLYLDLELLHLPTGQVVSTTTLPLEGSDYSPARAHTKALEAIRSAHPQLRAWVKELPFAAAQFKKAAR